MKPISIIVIQSRRGCGMTASSVALAFEISKKTGLPILSNSEIYPGRKFGLYCSKEIPKK